ncbi:hypothetical protein SKAU_G00414800 [Synaphobranchus kaupii]|uniref:PiggyBac transposable element-derived protein domain-containing protein n=1 Tax=Synaphobranchus kaupii TaxID=118154 RepID=A0A9Q1E7A1_SYNKA|nr:hypothetical protein SKAU_G00414800 [Synaphobranchus kaupii]
MGLRAPLTCTHHLSLNTSIRVSENSISELEYRRRRNMFTNSRRRELTDEEIREIFFNSDDEGDYNSESSGSDSDSEERLPPHLVSLERNPELGEGDDDVEENPEEGPSVVPCSRPEGPVPVEEVRSSDWRTAVNFTPPGPGIEFDSSISGVQNPPKTPTAVNCFRMFLSVETVGEIVEETNRYASEQQGKTAIGVIGKLSKWTSETPLNKIRNVFNALTSAFKRSFIPYKDLCVDESLMLWKGRLGFRQYIPSKRHRGTHAVQGLSAEAGERADPGASLTPAINWRATLRQHPTAAHREALSFFCASYRSPGTEHKAALQSLPLHHPTQKGEKTNPLHVFLM